MLLELIEERDNALDKYNMTGSLGDLGKYRKSVKALLEFIVDYGIEFRDVIDPLEEDNKKILKVKSTEKVVADIDDSWQNADYSISVGAEYAE